jgi:FKBP-type peptidyl-prolyl cis-trans isomerase FkpA
MRQLALLAGVVLVTGCLTHTDRCADITPSDPATETYAPTLHVNLASMTRTADGVYLQDVVVGSGDQLTAATLVELNYGAWLPNGVQVDTTAQGPTLLDLTTRAAPGVTEGMLGMRVGGQRLLVVPSNLALGPCGRGPIPPNSTLVYRIELLAINP